MLRSILFISLLISSIVGFSQSQPFQIILEPITIDNLDGVQSFAWGQHNGKWLIVGGRLDGLHQRQPHSAFDVAGHNNQLIVVDPVTSQTWSSAMTSLPTAIQEQLSATNLEFKQRGDYLYVIGGYGYSNTQSDHVTYDNLTAINVPMVIDAIINNTSLTSHFRQISDPKFQVTGGYLNSINDVFYLTGGQKFMGRYNPMGPTFGPGFIQEYTNESRVFKIIDDGTNLSIQHMNTYTDATNLHRRDYNVAQQIMPNKKEGFTVFSGVFNTNDLPYLDAINFDSTGYQIQPNFAQYYNHYHCAHIPLYSDSLNEMHTVFFGGIAQYFDNNGTLVKDDNVPFVNTVARVTRTSNGDMSEHLMPLTMPELLGAGSEFILNENIAHYANDVLKLDSYSDTTVLGYIFGGISSTAANIFFSNTGTQSSAVHQIFRVKLVPKHLVSVTQLDNEKSNLSLKVYPNPSDGTFSVQFNLPNQGDVVLELFSLTGKKIQELKLNALNAGLHTYEGTAFSNITAGSYLLKVSSGSHFQYQNIVIQ